MAWSFKRPSIPKKYQQWLKENRWWIQLVAIAVITMIVVIAFKKGAWSDWVGFKGKTVWNWLELLGIPVVLAILGYGLQQQQQKRAEVLSQKQQEIAADEAKEEILQAYFDRLSTLLIDKNILAIATKAYPLEGRKMSPLPRPTPEERELLGAALDVIRARTLSILRRFEGDGERKSSVLRFLIEAEVIRKAKLRLSDADLSGADLKNADLKNADLSCANLSGADLKNADLRGADLKDADLKDADLSSATLIGADLINADLSSAILARAYLGSSDLSNAILIGADLSGANLSGANLSGANLSSANLSGADFRVVKVRGADPCRADLSGAILIGAELTDADIGGVICDANTQWPAPEEVARAKNTTEVLKQQLGITGEIK